MMRTVRKAVAVVLLVGASLATVEVVAATPVGAKQLCVSANSGEIILGPWCRSTSMR